MGQGSLGYFYGQVCETCGFDWLAGEDWKVMGLAAYGKFDQKIYDLFKSMIKVDGLNLHQCSGDRFYFYLNKTL